jgi:hypothetical protein
MAVKKAECSCGQLRALCDGEPAKVSICHCDACRKRTGSAFGMAAFFTRGTVVVQGVYRSYTRDSDAGFPVTFRFCPECGTNLFWEPARKPDMIGIAAGAFVDPNLPMPDQSVGDSRRYSWITFPDSMRRAE